MLDTGQPSVLGLVPPMSVVKWAPLEAFLGDDPKANQIKEYLKALRERVSDHLPVVTRFYFSDERP